MSAANVKASDRVRRILDNIEVHYVREEIPVRDACYEEAFAANPEEPVVVKFALGFSNFLKKKRILLNEFDLLAGNAFRYGYNTTLPVSCPEDYDPHFRPTIDVDPMLESRVAIDYYGYEPGTEGHDTMTWFGIGVKNWLFKHWESGHVLAGYETVCRKGYGALLRECEESPNQTEYTRAMKIICQACIDYIYRYRDLAQELAVKASTPEYKAYMNRMAEVCGHIAEGPANNFLEAIQQTWFVQELLLAENEPSSLSLGRLDQYLYPYYKADLDAGKITYEEASDLMDALWIKLKITIHSFQNLTIGGTDKDGNYLGNDLTKICLQSSRKMGFDQPTLTMRYGSSMPDDIWDETAALIAKGGGFPALFNDPVCIQAKKQMGHSDEDAQNYAVIGCVEMGCPNKEYAKTEVLRVNWPKVMELMLNHGRCSISEDIIKPFTEKNLEDIKSFEEFYQWYKDELLAFSAKAMDAINRLDPMVPALYPTPYLSILMDGCIESGKDITAGGTIYNNTGISACGMADVADCLAVVKELVFDKKKYTLQELADAAYCDFRGEDSEAADRNAEIFADIMHCPKFGNDDRESGVDEYVSDLVNSVSALAENTKNPRGGKFQLGLYTVEDHSKMGLRTGGLINGKLSGVSLANGFSPVQGRDHEGPTAVINSVLKTDLSLATNGMVLDLKFSPSFLESDAHRKALRALVDTYFDQGGMEIQFNVVSRETLLDAQKNPEAHKDLVVRVSGFSAYFTTLLKATQDEIIARTEYAQF